MLEFSIDSTDLIREIMDISNNMRLQLVHNSSIVDITGWATIVMAAVSALSLCVALRTSNRQLNKVQQQIDNQKQQWTDEFFLKYKQQKFIEFRIKFLDVVGCVRTFHKVMGPGFLGMDFFKPQMESFFEYQPVYMEEPQNPDVCLSDSMKTVYELINFMVTEEVFINDIKWLYRDILSFSNSFLSFLQSINFNKLMKPSFVLNGTKWISQPNMDMRYLYLKHWTKIERDNVHTSLLHATKNKELLNDLSGDNFEKMRSIASDDKNFYYYLCVINEWVDMWRNTIDSVLLPASKKLKLSQNIELEKEQVPTKVTVPHYIKVVPDSKE